MRTVTLPNEELFPEVVEMLLEGNRVTIRVKGSSMLPFIVGDRDSVVLQKHNVYNIGDIVLAETSPRFFVLHRIIDIQQDKIVLMGDGNLSGTEECQEENIHGCVISIIHNRQEIDCNAKYERLKARIWQFLFPIRRYLLAIYRRIN